MGNRGDVYERYYMPSFVDKDCQAIYLGSTRRDDLIRAVGRIARHERAPKFLDDVQKFEISRHPEVLKLIEKRKRYVQKIKDRGYSTIKSAKKTKWYDEHKDTQAELNAKKQQLKNELLEKTIAEFHKNVHIELVNEQMRGICPSDVPILPVVEYELEERATVAKLLFMPLEGLTEDQILQVRIELVENLVQLCKKQETPHQYKAKRGRPPKNPTNIPNLTPDVDWDTKTLVDDDSDLDSTAPTEIEERPPVHVLYCAFCKWVDEEAGPRKREYEFSRIDSLVRHIRAQHLKPRAIGEGFDCPYRGCSAFLGDADHFLNHTERQHWARL